MSRRLRSVDGSRARVDRVGGHRAGGPGRRAAGAVRRRRQHRRRRPRRRGAATRRWPRAIGRIAVRTGSGPARSRARSYLDGDCGVPLVAYDGSPSGLSADGDDPGRWSGRGRRFPRGTTSSPCSTPPGCGSPTGSRSRGLQLRRDLAGRALALPGPVHRPREIRSTTRCALRPRRGELAAGADRRPRRARRGDERQPAARGRQPRRALGLHALRRRRATPFIHALDTGRGTAGLHRPRGMLDNPGNGLAYSLQPSADGCDAGRWPTGARRSRSSTRVVRGQRAGARERSPPPANRAATAPCGWRSARPERS